MTTTPPNALCVAWEPEELPVCRIGCGRGTRGGDLQFDRLSQNQWARSRSLSARGADPHRRLSHQPDRRPVALEHQSHISRSVHLTDSWTLNNTVHFGRLRSPHPWEVVEPGERDRAEAAAGQRALRVSVGHCELTADHARRIGESCLRAEKKRCGLRMLQIQFVVNHTSKKR